MKNFITSFQVRWADLDPNFHMLHSRYYDMGAQARMTYLVQQGITPDFMKQYQIGPIIFREECIFKREIGFGDEINIDVKIKKMTTDCSRWTMVHQVWKNKDTLAALMTCEGAWMNVLTRKLAIPPVEVISMFNDSPKTTDFLLFTKEDKKID
ncbi:MAG: acyl-CoA thioesterase [Bacteroidetes bacterium]|nr:acyl-CoA thioesterase [Bacteroidota bacterium]